MSTTNGFATVIQVSENALNALARAGHALGTINHAATWPTADDTLLIAADAPQVTLDSTSPPGELRLRAATRCLCHRWTTADPLGSHLACVANVTVRGRAALSAAGDPVPIDPDLRLVFDESSTTAGDVQFPVAIDPAAEASIAASFVALLAAEGNGQASLEALRNTFVSAGLRVLPANVTSGPVVAVGLNRQGFAGTAAGLTTNFCSTDWALAVDAQVVRSGVVSAIASQYGAAPPPNGPNPIIIDSQSGKVTYLDSFDVSLAPGNVSVTGALRQESGGLFGTVTGNFSADLSLSVDAAGNLQATTGTVTVSFAQWYATIANFITGGRLTDVVTTAVRDALSGPAVQSTLVDQIQAITQEIGMAGTSVIAPVAPVATAVSILGDAIVLQGTLGVSVPAAHPRLAIKAHLGSTPTQLTLDASGSWMPGGSLATLQWQFGDGTSVSTSGTGAAIAASHAFAAGGYIVTLTATDGAGRSSSATLGVTPGQLYCSLLSGSSPSEICQDKPIARVMVSTSGCLVEGAIIKAEGIGWAVYGRTDANGIAAVQIDPNEVAQHGIPAPKPSPFHVGLFKISAERPGYTGSSLSVWMVDCAGLLAVIEAAKKWRDQIIDRLVGYAALSDLLGRDQWLNATLNNLFPLGDGGIPQGPPFPPYDPSQPEVDPLVSSLKQSLTAYAGVARLAIGGVGAVAGADFNVDPKVLDRMTAPILKQIDEVGREMDSRYGPQRDPRRDPR